MRLQWVEEEKYKKLATAVADKLVGELEDELWDAYPGGISCN